jgi:hypothetical protein
MKMSAYLCPKGHDSAEDDFCSVCGAKIAAAPPPAPPCPDCGAARHPADTVFCEDCGFNFSTGAHGEPKAAAIHWEVAVAIDPSLRTDQSPEPPADFQPLTIPVEKDSNLIGRRSDKRAIFPEIALDSDDAVSHRHALLNRTPEGGLVLRDLGSANGTRVNGADVQPLTDTPLNNSDQITLGHWTRLTVRTA